MSSHVSIQSGRVERPKPGCEGAISRCLADSKRTNGCSGSKPPPLWRNRSGGPSPNSNSSSSTPAIAMTWRCKARPPGFGAEARRDCAEGHVTGRWAHPRCQSFTAGSWTQVNRRSGRFRQLRDPLPCGRLEARAVLHAMQPGYEIGSRRRQYFPLRRCGKEAELRRNQDVGQRHPVFGKVGLAPKQARKFVEHHMRLRHGIGDGCLVGLQAQKARPDDPLEADDVVDTPEQIPVADIHHLVHARGGFRIGGRQFGVGQHPVEIARDGLGLVEHEIIVFEHRHSPERMARKMRFLPVGAWCHEREPVARALLKQRCENRPAKRASRDTVNDKLGHGALLPQEWASAYWANWAMRVGQPPPSLSAWRAASAPKRSRLRCSSVTSVPPPSASAKVSSTSVSKSGS